MSDAQDTASQLAAAKQLHLAGRFLDAATVYQALLAAQPTHAETWHLLGLALLQLDQPAMAVDALQMAVQFAPAQAAYQFELGQCLMRLERHGDAVPVFETVMQLVPGDVAPRLRLIDALREQERYGEALALYDPLLQADPGNAALRYNVGIMRWLMRDLAGALDDFVHALKLNERFFDAHHVLVSVLEKEPDYNVALQALQAALERHRFAPQLHSVIAYSTDFNPALTASDQQQVRKDYYRQQIVPQQIKPLPLKVVRDPDRKLRIGFVPGRFWRNASIYAYLPILLQLDRGRFDVWCYDNFPKDDEFTAQIRARADGWCDITGMTDADVAKRIRDDRIDILVDLFAHAGANRLPVYAYKPAPVIVTAWGHANGTGMDCVDYLFSDPISIPPEEVGFYAEHVHYLPCQLSYWLPENAPPVAPLPMEKNGYVTFGCFNRMVKVSDAVLETWAQLLASLPGARLVLKAAEFEEAVQVNRVYRIFRRHGVADERLTLYQLSPWHEHLQRFAEVDFALDPFPMGGGVTTLDSLWMGVPVLCLRGNTLGQRITSAIMTAVGLDDWVSTTPEDYVRLAVEKSAQLEALKHLRATLRRRMAASPLANPDYYVGCVEDAFIAFWQYWCRGEKMPPPTTATFGIAEHAKEADRLWQDFLSRPDAVDVQQRLADSMRRAGKIKLAEEFSPR